MSTNTQTVSVTVLIIAVLLTALVTTAIFICIGCITLRSRTRRREYEQEQQHIESPPPLNTPHIIDLHKSYAGSPRSVQGTELPPMSPSNLELSKVGGGGGHSRTPSLLSPRLEPSRVGLGLHVRGDSIGGSSEALLRSPIPQAKLPR